VNARVNRQPGSQFGLTLMEILVALVIGIFVIGAVIQIFVSSSHINRTQEALSRIQENGRFALEMLAQDVRAAGFLGCQSNLTPEAPGATGVLAPGFVRNTLNTASDSAFDFFAPLRGYEASASDLDSVPAC
jgi:type IV pilus assembly protein PilW